MVIPRRCRCRCVPGQLGRLGRSGSQRVRLGWQPACGWDEGGEGEGGLGLGLVVGSRVGFGLLMSAREWEGEIKQVVGNDSCRQYALR